jgi:serine/threonine-protein kinase
MGALPIDRSYRMFKVNPRRHGLLMALVLLTTTATSTVALQSPAQAYVGENTLRNWLTGRCLDSNADGDVYSRPCSLPIGSNHHQIWRPQLIIRGNGNGAYDIVRLWNKATGKCLVRRNVSGSAKVQTKACERGATASENWDAVGTGWRVVKFRPVLDRSRCLGGNATSAYAYGCTTAGNQDWRLGY